MTKLAVVVNGTAHQSEVEPRTLLVYYLREVLGLTGTKVGCDTSSCGACTVLLDGAAVNSCSVLAVQADGGRVETVAALSGNGSLHPLQQELVERGAVQCGFCTPGVVLGAVEAVRLGLAEDRRAIRRSLAGNLCRCTGYHNIVEAVMAAAGK